MISKRGKRKLLKRLNSTERYIKRKISLAGIFLGSMMAVIVIMVFMYRVNRFYDQYRIIIRWPSVSFSLTAPLEIEKRSIPTTPEIVSPLPRITESPKKKESKEDLVQSSLYPDFIDHIWFRESGRGTNKNPKALHNICKTKGMTNEFGYDPYTGHCFPSFGYGIRVMENWRINHRELSDNQALCLYNGAGKAEDCPYLHYNFSAMK